MKLIQQNTNIYEYICSLTHRSSKAPVWPQSVHLKTNMGMMGHTEWGGGKEVEWGHLTVTLIASKAWFTLKKMRLGKLIITY